MADVGEEFELGEILLILLAVGVGIYLLYKFVTGLGSGTGTIGADVAKGWKMIFNPKYGTLCCPQVQAQLHCPKVQTQITEINAGQALASGNYGPITPEMANGIAQVAFGGCMGWSLSFDHHTLTFDNGNKYVLPPGHFYDACGTDLGIDASQFGNVSESGASGSF